MTTTAVALRIVVVDVATVPQRDCEDDSITGSEPASVAAVSRRHNVMNINKLWHINTVPPATGEESGKYTSILFTSERHTLTNILQWADVSGNQQFSGGTRIGR